MADYYEQGVRPPTRADAVASRYSGVAVNGALPGGVILDALFKTEADPLADSSLA